MKTCINFLIWVLLASVPLSVPVQGQIRTAATVIDPDGSPVPSVYVSSEAHRGVLTNADGQFALTRDTYPISLRLQHPAYRTRRVTLTEEGGGTTIRLEPLTYDASDVGITGEEVVRRVRDQLRERQAEMPGNRSYSLFLLQNEDDIVIAEEVWGRIYGQTDYGINERTVTRQREPAEFTGVSMAQYHPPRSFYEGTVSINDFQFIGPLHETASRYYDFEVAGTAGNKGNRIFEIRVVPRTRLQPVFEGVMHVCAETFTLKDVRLRVSDSVLLEPPVSEHDITFWQQYATSDGVHAPVDWHVAGTLTAAITGLAIPNIQFEQHTVLRGAGSDERPRLLTEQEERALQPGAGSDDIADAFPPTGFLTVLQPLTSWLLDYDLSLFEREARTEAPSGPMLWRRANPAAWFNRSEALHVEVAPELPVSQRGTTGVTLGYSTGPAMWTYGGHASWAVGPKSEGRIGASYRRGIEPRYGRGRPGERFETGMDMLGLGNLTPDEDYFDYYGRERLHIETAYAGREHDMRLSLSFRDERHFSVRKTTDFHLYGDVDPFGDFLLIGGIWDYPDVYRRNPPIDEGRLRSLGMEWGWLDGRGYLARPGRRGVRAAVEYSPRGYLGDFHFARVEMEAAWHVNTLLSRRPNPGQLDLLVQAGTSAGQLPLQRLFSIYSDKSPYHDFGILNTVGVQPYQGEHYLALFWHHDFQTLPFEWLGLHGLARQGLRLALLGGHGRTWLSPDWRADRPFQPLTPEGMHHEVGIALHGILGVVSVDLTKRLDGPGFDWGIDVEHIL